MTEEEMQRYLKKKDEGVMYRVEHAAEVYNKAKGDGRVVPEDVDKKTSEGIEKKFYEEIGDIEKRISESQRKLFEEQVANNFEDFYLSQLGSMVARVSRRSPWQAGICQDCKRRRI